MDFKKLREKAFKETINEVRKEKKETDNLVVQAVEAIDELDDITNIIVERVKNWYAFHYPELEKLVKDPMLYLLIIKEIKSRDQMLAEKLERFVGPERAKAIAEKAVGSMGAEIVDKDLQRLVHLAELGIHARQERDELADYIEERTKEITPNLHAMLGGMLAARLIARAGSLERLAKMPASTVQVLGAEKALFAHLRRGVPSPKHGLIFQFPQIIQSPKKQRGKISRALAGKVSIAAKEDFFGNKDISKELIQSFEKRVEAIKEGASKKKGGKHE
ncbi:MAG: NOP58 family protein [Candidatus Diapherotrites archaeon]|nr:NOP58 family protein [Candidatus Diapherotrites archaeon]